MKNTRVNKFWTIVVILTFSLLILFYPTVVNGDEIEEEGEEEEEELLYFYKYDPSCPIKEDIAPQNEEDVRHERPDFIYNPNSGHRLVEYYAHWCPHCQHFRNHYIEFSYRLQAMAKQYNVEIGTYAVSCVPHKPICRDQGVKSYPKMFLYLDGSTEQIEINVAELHPFQVLRRIPGVIESSNSNNNNMMMEEDGIISIEQQEHQLQNSNNDKINNLNLRNKFSSKFMDKAAMTNEKKDDLSYFLPRTKKDIYHDAYLSFDFTMRNSIYQSPNPIANTTAGDAFEEFILLLQSALPPSFELQKMILDIVKNLPTVMTSEDNLLSIVDKYPLPPSLSLSSSKKNKNWSLSCTRGEPYAGYTCGLWELFHIMSIGFVEYNLWNVGDDWSFYHPNDVATILRDFIEHFFGCEVCRINFLHSYEACDHDRCNRLIKKAGNEYDWREFPLWLFEVHNSVNLRLLRERAERENRKTTYEEELSVRWPSQSACPACWYPDGRWDPDMIYYFLRLTYWTEDPTSALQRQLLIEASSRADGDDAEGDDDEDAAVLKYIALFATLFFVASFYDRVRVARTGRHKKVDE